MYLKRITVNILYMYFYYFLFFIFLFKRNLCSIYLQPYMWWVWMKCKCLQYSKGNIIVILSPFDDTTPQVNIHMKKKILLYLYIIIIIKYWKNLITVSLNSKSDLWSKRHWLSFLFSAKDLIITFLSSFEPYFFKKKKTTKSHVI